MASARYITSHTRVFWRQWHSFYVAIRSSSMPTPSVG